MLNVWIIQMDDYRSGVTFEVATTREVAISWLVNRFNFNSKQWKELNDSDLLTYKDENHNPASINLVYCPIIKE